MRSWRWPLVCVTIAVLGLLLAGCGGSSGSSHTSSTAASTSPGGHVEDGTTVYGALPPSGTPVHGDTISFGQITDESPTEILPILSGATVSTPNFELNAAMYLPLFNGPEGAKPEVDYAQSVAAGPPTFTNGDKTVTITLRRGLKWSNGAPVVANDVLFYMALLRAAVRESAANWAQFIPGQIPQGMSETAPNPHTVVFHLDSRYNPGYFVDDQLQDTDGGVFPLPSTDWNVDRAGGPHVSDWENPAVAEKIYNYLSKAGTSVSTFASDPLWQDVDGAFRLKSFSSVDGAYDLVPNPSYGLSPKPDYTNLSVETYTSQSAALDALRSGSVDIIQLDPSQLGEANGLRSDGVSVFGAPSFGWAAGGINFEDKTDDFNHVIGQLYVRQALEHLVDEPGLIKGAYKGAAAEAFGPVPSAPSSPYASANATKPLYSYSPADAVALLKAHGWTVKPGGETTCAKPGTGSGECGAGIPTGTPIKFTWISAPGSVSTAELLDAEAVASVAKQSVGIEIAVSVKSETIIQNDYDDSFASAAKYDNDWGVLTTQPVALIDYYPTQSGFDSPGALDIGGYDSPTENHLIENSLRSGNLHAVESETSYVAHDLPQLFLPNPDILFAVKGVTGPADSWLSLTEGSAFFPQYWSLTK